MKKTLIALLALSGMAMAATTDLSLTYSSALPSVTPDGGTYAGIVFTLADNARLNVYGTGAETAKAGDAFTLTSICAQVRTKKNNTSYTIPANYCLFVVDENKTLLAVSEATTAAVSDGDTAIFSFAKEASVMTNTNTNHSNQALTLGGTYYAFLLDASRYSSTTDRNYNASIGAVVPSNNGNPWCDSNAQNFAAYQTGVADNVLQAGFLSGDNGDLDPNAGSKSYMPSITISGTVTPEPATATLSLLALAGLAARRRRH